MMSVYTIKSRISDFLAVLFIITSILNLILIDIVPAILYLLLGLIYTSAFNNLLERTFGFFIPYWLRFLLAFLVLWGTLGVGDLAEYFGL